jgi:hypothetical protein
MKELNTDLKKTTVKSKVDLIVIAGVEHTNVKGKDIEVDADLVPVLLAHDFIESQE